MNLTHQDTVREALECADDVVIGIGSEFGVNISEVIKENSLYRTYMQICDDGSIDDITKAYIKHSIYNYELQQGSNSVISRYVEGYQKLTELINEKNFFLITTCTDDVIYKSNFQPERIVAPCGSILRLQRQCKCNDTQEDGSNGAGLVDGTRIFERIYDELESQNVSVIKDIIPVCGECGQPMSSNVYGTKDYNENGYIMQWEKYMKWLQRTLNRKLVLLELGVDFEVPSVIRWPFEKMATLNYKAMLYRINKKFPQLPEEVKGRGTSIKENSFEFIENM